jgi:hypothetical protein
VGTPARCDADPSDVFLTASRFRAVWHGLGERLACPTTNFGEAQSRLGDTRSETRVYMT